MGREIDIFWLENLNLKNVILWELIVGGTLTLKHIQQKRVEAVGSDLVKMPMKCQVL
jgi:hypothetical protein